MSIHSTINDSKNSHKKTAKSTTTMNKKNNNNMKKQRNTSLLSLYSIITSIGDLSEIAIFGVTTIISFYMSLHQTTSSPWYYFLTMLPINYSTAYATSRAVMALELMARSNQAFKLHRLAGIFSLPYSLLCWYRIVILNLDTMSSNNYYYWFELLDTIAWCIAAICATVNVITGIFMLPHVNKRQPIVRQQGYGVGATLCVFFLLVSFLGVGYKPLRVEGNWLACSFYLFIVAIATLIGIAPFIMAIYMVVGIVCGQKPATAAGGGVVQTASRKHSKQQQQQQHQNIVTNNKNITNTNKNNNNNNTVFIKKTLYQKIKPFFFDVFVNPDSIRIEGTKQDKTPTWMVLANIVFGIGGPILSVVALCVKYGFENDLPGLSPINQYSKRVAMYLFTADSIINFAVLPATMFDLTLLFLKKKNEKRIAMEIVIAIICATVLLPTMLPGAVFTKNEMQIQNELNERTNLIFSFNF